MDVREGSVALTVPEQPDAGTGEAVFFNPVQELNRDVTIAVLRTVRDRTDATRYLDATTATGVRGVRAAAEGWTVTCCDVDPAAVALAQRNFARNGLAGTVHHRDANALLAESRFDVVDVDPFGTPVPFADAAIRGAREMVCVTATDTAPLCGAHFRSGVRRYGAVPRNTEYHAEMGLRVLLSALVRTAAKYDIAATPVLSHVSDHYVRTYLTLASGATAADACLDELGYVHHCPECLHRDHDRGLIATPPSSCPHCGGEHVLTAGPLWVAPPHDPDFVTAVRENLSAEMGTTAEAEALLETIAAELETPTHYDQHRLSARWGEPAIGMEAFLAAIHEAGYDATRTHYGGTTFKTTADVAAIRAAVPSHSD